MDCKQVEVVSYGGEVLASLSLIGPRISVRGNAITVVDEGGAMLFAAASRYHRFREKAARPVAQRTAAAELLAEFVAHEGASEDANEVDANRRHVTVFHHEVIG